MSGLGSFIHFDERAHEVRRPVNLHIFVEIAYLDHDIEKVSNYSLISTLHRLHDKFVVIDVLKLRCDRIWLAEQVRILGPLRCLVLELQNLHQDIQRLSILGCVD